MRYSDGGRLTAKDRSRREPVRLQAAEMFEHGEDARAGRELAAGQHEVGVPVAARWQAGGEAALASKGAGGSPCKLDESQLAQLRAALEAGPGAYGWEQDQRWTLARVVVLTERLSGVSYTLRGVSFLLHRSAAPATPVIDPAHPGTPWPAVPIKLGPALGSAGPLSVGEAVDGQSGYRWTWLPVTFKVSCRLGAGRV